MRAHTALIGTAWYLGSRPALPAQPACQPSSSSCLQPLSHPDSLAYLPALLTPRPQPRLTCPPTRLLQAPSPLPARGQQPSPHAQPPLPTPRSPPSRAGAGCRLCGCLPPPTPHPAPRTPCQACPPQQAAGPAPTCSSARRCWVEPRRRRARRMSISDAGPGSLFRRKLAGHRCARVWGGVAQLGDKVQGARHLGANRQGGVPCTYARWRCIPQHPLATPQGGCRGGE